jgi:hypothetical protein
MLRMESLVRHLKNVKHFFGASLEKNILFFPGVTT